MDGHNYWETSQQQFNYLSLIAAEKIPSPISLRTDGQTHKFSYRAFCVPSFPHIIT